MWPRRIRFYPPGTILDPHLQQQIPKAKSPYPTHTFGKRAEAAADLPRRLTANLAPFGPLSSYGIG
jgi:hypothetical protein